MKAFIIFFCFVMYLQSAVSKYYLVKTKDSGSPRRGGGGGYGGRRGSGYNYDKPANMDGNDYSNDHQGEVINESVTWHTDPTPAPEAGRLPGGGTANHDHEIAMPQNPQHDHNGEVISESVTWPTDPTPAPEAGRLPGGGTGNHDHEITTEHTTDTTLSPEAIAFLTRLNRKRH